MKGKLAAFFIREKATSRLSRDANEDQLAGYCIATIQGAMLMGKIQRSSELAETTIREALAHLKRYAVPPK